MPLASISQAGGSLEWTQLSVPSRVAGCPLTAPSSFHPMPALGHCFLLPSLSSCPTLPVVARVSMSPCIIHLSEGTRPFDLAWPHPSIPARHCFSRFIKNTMLCPGKSVPRLCPWSRSDPLLSPLTLSPVQDHSPSYTHMPSFNLMNVPSTASPDCSATSFFPQVFGPWQ